MAGAARVAAPVGAAAAFLGLSVGAAHPACAGGSCPSEDAEHGDISVLQIRSASRAAGRTNRSSSLPYVPEQCRDTTCNVGCDWTRSWSCAGQAMGSSGVAGDDNSDSYECCCTHQLYKYADAGLNLCDYPALSASCKEYMCSQGCGWTSDWSCPSQKQGAAGKAGNDGSEGFKCCCEAEGFRYADSKKSFECPAKPGDKVLPRMASASDAKAAELWVTKVDSQANAEYILQAQSPLTFRPLSLVQEGRGAVAKEEERPAAEEPRLVCDSSVSSHACRVEPPVDWAEAAPETLLQRDAGSVRTVTVKVDQQKAQQTMVGFGAAMTHSSAIVLKKLKTRDDGLYYQVMSRLFGSGSESASISLVRVPIGSSDYAVTANTYDDLDARQGGCWGGLCATHCSLPGHPCSSAAWDGKAGNCQGGNCWSCGGCCCVNADYNLARFKLDNDTLTIIDVLKDAKAINPGLLLMGSPWSPPAWLKAHNDLIGRTADNTLIDDWQAYQTYAQYLGKVKDAWAAHGLPFEYLTLQNEPQAPPVEDYPGMSMTPQNYARLGREVKKVVGDSPKLLMFDHNWDHHEFPEQGLDAAPDAFAGTAFHCYGGSMPEAHDAVFRKYPGKDIMVTECTGSYPNSKCDISQGMHSFGWNHQWDMENLFLNAALHHASAGVKWIMALDEHCGPTLPGVKFQWGRPLVSIPGGAQSMDDIKFNQDFWTVAHMARFVRKGAQLIEAKVEGSDAIVGAFRDDAAGTVTVMALNKDHSQKFNLRVEFEGRLLVYEVPAFSTAVIRWP